MVRVVFKNLNQHHSKVDNSINVNRIRSEANLTSRVVLVTCLCTVRIVLLCERSRVVWAEWYRASLSLQWMWPTNHRFGCRGYFLSFRSFRNEIEFRVRENLTRSQRVHRVNRCVTICHTVSFPSVSIIFIKFHVFF